MKQLKKKLKPKKKYQNVLISPEDIDALARKDYSLSPKGKKLKHRKKTMSTHADEYKVVDQWEDKNYNSETQIKIYNKKRERDEIQEHLANCNDSKEKLTLEHMVDKISMDIRAIRGAEDVRLFELIAESNTSSEGESDTTVEEAHSAETQKIASDIKKNH